MTDSSVICKQYKPDRLTILPRRALDPPAPLQGPLGRRVPPWQWLQSADGQGSVPGGMVCIMCFNSSLQTGLQISGRSSLSRKKANQLWGRLPDFLTWFSVKIFPSVPIWRPLWQTCKSSARSSRMDRSRAFASKDSPSCSQSRTYLKQQNTLSRPKTDLVNQVSASQSPEWDPRTCRTEGCVSSGFLQCAQGEATNLLIDNNAIKLTTATAPKESCCCLFSFWHWWKRGSPVKNKITWALDRWTHISMLRPAWTRSICWGTLRRRWRLTGTSLSLRCCFSRAISKDISLTGRKRNNDVEASLRINEPHSLRPHDWHAWLPRGGLNVLNSCSGRFNTSSIFTVT